jgi:hypothetical protein
METKTGMLISCRIKGKMEGTFRVMGREVPIVINTSVKVMGRRMEEAVQK